jgi:hypothetical protein
MARHGRGFLNGGIGVLPPAGGAVAVVYNDSPSGQITLSGTKVEDFLATRVMGQITLSGAKGEAASHISTVTGTIFLSGTRG